ncbi:hypothetical protein CBR_g34169 [Chara braunii]|uniref:EF-hand domain-containing protein n=1 Tax=Chara braunii TaxID=69332 RepID=A0A388LI50_CHABU|nr:hypothetical protein CBR_g34169 [Chara braunii]|eukprot:GBG81989.1 hypothetical protein CBR_g34169 [Chara braunii]
MQYYTKQQQQGAQRYTSCCRVGNWNEDVEIGETLLKDYLAKKSKGLLKLDKFKRRMACALAPVELTTVADDGFVHFGDLVRLRNLFTEGYLACDVEDKDSRCAATGEFICAATVSDLPSTTEPCARNTFIIRKYKVPPRQSVFDQRHDHPAHFHHEQEQERDGGDDDREGGGEEDECQCEDGGGEDGDGQGEKGGHGGAQGEGGGNGGGCHGAEVGNGNGHAEEEEEGGGHHGSGDGEEDECTAWEPCTVLHYGEKFRLVANPMVQGRQINDLQEPLYLHSYAHSPGGFYSRYSRHQEVVMTATRNYGSVWAAVCLDPTRRMLTEGDPVRAGDALVLEHKATGTPLCCEGVIHGNDFGKEMELSSHFGGTLRSVLRLEHEGAGMPPQFLIKAEGVSNYWAFEGGNKVQVLHFLMPAQGKALQCLDRISRTFSDGEEGGDDHHAWAQGFYRLQKKLEDMDVDASGWLSRIDFTRGVSFVTTIDLDKKDVDALITFLGFDGVDNICYRDFLMVLQYFWTESTTSTEVETTPIKRGGKTSIIKGETTCMKEETTSTKGETTSIKGETTAIKRETVKKCPF